MCSGGTSEEGGEVSVRDAENVSPASRCASFFALESFLLGLTSANDDGRIIVKREGFTCYFNVNGSFASAKVGREVSRKDESWWM